MQYVLAGVGIPGLSQFLKQQIENYWVIGTRKEKISKTKVFVHATNSVVHFPLRKVAV